MGEPMTKQRLSNYIKLKAEVEHYLERIARMKNDERFPAMKESDGSQHQPGASDRMANAVIRRLNYEDKMAPRIHANLDEMEAIEKAIDALDDPMERDVLHSRYLESDPESVYKHTPWGVISTWLYGDNDEKSLQATYRLHGRALQNIRKVEYVRK